MPRFLTKSRFKLGLECPTKLYYTKKEEIYADSGLTDPFLAALAEGGFQVGELAKSYFPEGHDIETLDYDESLEQTAALLRTDEATVFEAAVKHDNLFIRVDVLKKTATRLDLIEVKAKSIDPTEVAPFETRNGIDSRWKPYLYDVAFQKLVVAAAFPHCEVRAYLMLVDKSVVCPTDGLHHKFAIVDEGNGRRGARQISDLTDEELANPILTRVNVDRHCQKLFDEAVETTEGPTRLEERIKWLAEHYERDEKIISRPSTTCAHCQFRASEEDEEQGLRSGFKECWKAAFDWSGEEFDQPTVLDVWNYRGKAALLDEGRARISEVVEEDINPRSDGKPGMSRSERQWFQIQKAATNDCDAYLDREGLKREMRRWKFPLHFIDFETATPAVPLNRGRRPYETIAFQFSHHIVDEDGGVRHVDEYLNTTRGEFPNYEFVRKLRESLSGDSGSIFRYAHHENTVLNAIHRQLEDDAVEDRRELQTFIESISRSGRNSTRTWSGARNMIDLCELVKRYYYSPSTNGSNSIKYVLPAILNDSEFLQQKYAQPIYGADGGIHSRNFKDKRWIEADGDRVKDPYQLLPKMIEDASEADLAKVDDGEIIRDGEEREQQAA